MPRSKERKKKQWRHKSINWAAHYHQQYVRHADMKNIIFIAYALFKNKSARLRLEYKDNTGVWANNPLNLLHHFEVHYNDRNKVSLAKDEDVVLAKLKNRWIPILDLEAEPANEDLRKAIKWRQKNEIQ